MKLTVPEIWKLPLRLALTLLAFFVAASVLLAAVDALTRTAIHDHNEHAREAAKHLVFPGAYFEPVRTETREPVKEIHVVYEAIIFDEHGRPEAYSGFLGYAVKVAPRGFGGEIEMMVGISPDKTVINVEILTMNEVAGIGDRTDTPVFLSQYTGTRIGLRTGSGFNAVEGVTGASVSSEAVTEGVAMALEAVDRITGLPDAPDYITGGAAQ
jgi:electron transport complex protein RnfG